MWGFDVEGSCKMLPSDVDLDAREVYMMATFLIRLYRQQMR